LFGSSHGWLISVDDENGAITLSNPFCSKVKRRRDHEIIRLASHRFHVIVISSMILLPMLFILKVYFMSLINWV
jgi:hypothetical protein